MVILSLPLLGFCMLAFVVIGSVRFLLTDPYFWRAVRVTLRGKGDSL